MAEYIFTNLPQYVKLNSRSEFSSSVVSSGAVLIFSEDGITLTGKLPDGSFITIGGSGSGGTDVSSTTAEAADVLSGKIFFTSGGVMTSGTIPTVSASISGNLVIVPSGYIAASQSFNVSGGVDVSDTTATPAAVLGGYDFYDSAGVKTTGTIPNVSSATITPTTSNQIISSGVYLGGEQTILGDANLVGSNILSGVSIFGVPGTLVTSTGAEVTLGYISSGLFQPLTFYGTSAYNGGSAVNLSCYNWNLPEHTSYGVIIDNHVTSSVLSGEIWDNTTVNSGGSMYVQSGGTANSTTVNPLGHMEISSGGIADTVTVNSGSFAVRGGTANNINITQATVAGISGGIANKIVISERSNLLVFSGGTINSTTVVDLAACQIKEGGVANDTVLKTSGAIMGVSSGGTANSTTVSAYGRMYVYSGGTATDVIVSSGGTMTIYTGAVTSNITSETGAVIINS